MAWARHVLGDDETGARLWSYARLNVPAPIDTDRLDDRLGADLLRTFPDESADERRHLLMTLWRAFWKVATR
jgi:hypothetical protein